MLIARIMTSAAAVLALSVVSVAPAGAGLVSPPKYRDAFDDDICGIAAHVVISADNPIVETGRLTAAGEPASVDTGHLACSSPTSRTVTGWRTTSRGRPESSRTS